MMRPGAAVEEECSWEKGAEVPLWEVALDQWVPGASLVVTKGVYYGAEVQVAGRIQKVERTIGGTQLQVKLSGTTSEAILRVATSSPAELFQIHVCPQDCAQVECGDHLIHAMKGRKGKDDRDEDWTRSLEGAGREAAPMEDDELEALRKRSLAEAEAEAEKKRARKKAPEDVVEESPKEEDEEKKKKKKDKKTKKKEKNLEDGRHPKAASSKKLQMVFGGTGLDPTERIQKRVLRRAQKFMAKRKKRASSSSDSSDQEDGSSSASSWSGAALELEGVFNEENKTRALADRFPGILTLDCITTMRRSLLTTAGEEESEGGTKPVCLLYYRNQLARKATGAQSRELLNLCSALDCLLKGKPAQAADILSQRIKAQEAILHGTTWTIAQRMEVTQQEAHTVVGRAELRGAQKEDYEDARSKWRTQQTGGKKGDSKGKNKGGKNSKDSWGKDHRKEDDKKDKGKGGDRK